MRRTVVDDHNFSRLLVGQRYWRGNPASAGEFDEKWLLEMSIATQNSLIRQAWREAYKLISRAFTLISGIAISLFLLETAVCCRQEPYTRKNGSFDILDC